MIQVNTAEKILQAGSTDGYNLVQRDTAKKNPVNNYNYQYKPANAISKGIPL